MDAILPPRHRAFEALLNRILPAREYRRALSPYEKRVDFEAARKVFDEDAWEADLKIREQVKKARDSLLKTVKERAESNALTPQWVGTMTVDTPPIVVDILADYLMDVWRKGRDLALRELPENVSKGLADVKRFAGLEPTKAVEYLRNTRPWLIKGVIDDELKKQARSQLAEHLKGGRPLSETLGNLRDIFEPWIGDPTKITPTGQRGIGFPPGEFAPENILMAYRVENIIRTESVTAFAQGRVAVGDEAADFVIGYELSAILDSRTCVHPGTLIKLANGKCRPIEQVKPGDRIVSGIGKVRRVAACWRYPARRWARIRIADGREIICTLTHQWWTKNGWTETVDLTPTKTDIGTERGQRIELDSVPPVWPQIPPIQQQSAQILLTPMLSANPADYYSDMRWMREDVSEGEGRDKAQILRVPLLSEMEEQRRLDESSMCLLRQGFYTPAERRPGACEEILQPRLLSPIQSRANSQGMSHLQSAIRGAQKQREPISRLFYGLQQDMSTQGRSAETDNEAVSTLSPPFQPDIETFRCEEESPTALLLAEMPPSGVGKQQKNDQMFKMQQDHASSESGHDSILFKILLAEVDESNENRANGGTGPARITPYLRKRMAGRKILRRFLLARTEDGIRNGRRVLALSSARHRPEKGCLSSDMRDRASPVPVQDSYFSGRRPTATYADHTPEPASADFVGISMIEQFEQIEWAYDLEIEGDHSYIANGLISHNTEICQAADGIKFPKDHRLAVKLTPALHYQCRTIPVFIVTDDLPVAWSTEAELDRVARLIPADFK